MSCACAGVSGCSAHSLAAFTTSAAPVAGRRESVLAHSSHCFQKHSQSISCSPELQANTSSSRSELPPHTSWRNRLRPTASCSRRLSLIFVTIPIVLSCLRLLTPNVAPMHVRVSGHAPDKMNQDHQPPFQLRVLLPPLCDTSHQRCPSTDICHAHP